VQDQNHGGPRSSDIPLVSKTSGLVTLGNGISVPTEVLYVTQYCFRALNRPSGLDFGRTATGKTLKSALRPARPAGGPNSVLSR
jgi:hypothetical protein